MKTRTSIIQLWVGSTRDASAVTMSLSIPFSSGSGGNQKCIYVIFLRYCNALLLSSLFWYSVNIIFISGYWS
jgi:hypothetical protein